MMPLFGQEVIVITYPVVACQDSSEALQSTAA